MRYDVSPWHLAPLFPNDIASSNSVTSDLNPHAISFICREVNQIDRNISINNVATSKQSLLITPVTSQYSQRRQCIDNITSFDSTPTHTNPSTPNLSITDTCLNFPLGDDPTVKPCQSGNSVLSFMAFSLVLSGYILSATSNFTAFPRCLGLGVDTDTYDATSILKEIRINNINRVIIGTLNINSLPSKFDQLKLVIGNYLDILVVQETKLDPSFSTEQFLISGYTKPYRIDRNRNRVGVIIYVREDIPSIQLKKHNFTKNIEGLFVEVNLRKTKLLFFGTYHSTHPKYGLSDTDYFQQVGLALDVYSNYEKFLLAGDFNVDEKESCIKNFLFEYNAKNLVKEKTCFKSIENPSCIDLFLTNSYQSFQNTTTVTTGLSDFHKMVVTVMKTTFPKAKPKVIQYRDYKKFIIENFQMELRIRLQNEIVDNYGKFEEIFLENMLHSKEK